MLDGMSGKHFNNYISQVVRRHDPTELDAIVALNDDDLVEELEVTIDPDMEERIEFIRKSFRGTYTPIEFLHHKSKILDKAFFRRHKCPVKAGYQALIQLACLLYYNYQPKTWETISLSRFRGGRIDWVQPVNSSMAAFCAAARADAIPRIEQRRMFFAAVTTFVNTVTKISRGYGFKAHMHALLAMVGKDEEVPELFEQEAWRDTAMVSVVKTVRTDCLEGATLQEAGFLLPEEKCIFVHYEVEDDG